MDNDTLNQQKQVTIYRYDKLSSPIYNYAIKICFLGFVSYKIYQKIPHFLRWRKYYGHLSEIKSAEAKDAISNKIVYCQGSLNFDSSKQIKDLLFGVISQQNLGLYRKVEIYRTLAQQKKQDWQNVNYIDEKMIPKEAQELKSQVLTNSEVYIKDFILSNNLLQIVAQCFSKQVSLDKDNIIKYFETIKQQQKRLDTNSENEQQIKNENLTLGQMEQKLSNQIYQNHPFKISEESQRFIQVYGDSIYIVKTLKELSEGDIKISYYDINKVSNLTILGLKNYNTISDFQVPEYAKTNEIVEIQYSEDNKFHLKLGQIGFAFKGNLSEEDILEEFKFAIKKYTFPDIVIVLLLAYLYSLITDQFFGFKCSLTEEEMKKVAKQMVEKINDTRINVNNRERNKFLINFSALILTIIHLQTSLNFAQRIYIVPSTILLLSGAAYISIEIKKVIEFSKILDQEIRQQKQELQQKLQNDSQNQKQ
ncbi:hypothetical protein ABPG74_009166 [Tetrahymena malaccensis]